jgi:hypothetical protein
MMRLTTAVASAILTGLCALLLAASAAYVLGEPLESLTRDAAATLDVLPTTGALSVLNGMVWSAAGVLSIFVAWVHPAERGRMRPFGALLLFLAADDALLLHEYVGPYVGVPEVAFYVAYVVAAGWILWAFVKAGVHRITATYVLGGAFLGCSVLLDVANLDLYFVEDGVKLIGALVWFVVPVLLHGHRTTFSEGPEGDRPGARGAGPQATVGSSTADPDG